MSEKKLYIVILPGRSSPDLKLYFTTDDATPDEVHRYEVTPAEAALFEALYALDGISDPTRAKTPLVDEYRRSILRAYKEGSQGKK